MCPVTEDRITNMGLVCHLYTKTKLLLHKTLCLLCDTDRKITLPMTSDWHNVPGEAYMDKTNNNTSLTKKTLTKYRLEPRL